MSPKNLLIALLVVVSLAACGEKKAPESAEAAEAKRSLMLLINETSTNLAALGRHDKQYYIDRFTETLNKCSKNGDIDISCFQSGLESIKSE